MKKVFLVMLEDGSCAFSRVPGDANGMRRTHNFKKKEEEQKSGSPAIASMPADNTTDHLTA